MSDVTRFQAASHTFYLVDSEEQRDRLVASLQWAAMVEAPSGGSAYYAGYSILIVTSPEQEAEAFTQIGTATSEAPAEANLQVSVVDYRGR